MPNGRTRWAIEREQRRADRKFRNEQRREERKEVNLQYENKAWGCKVYNRQNQDIGSDNLYVMPYPSPPREELRALESSPDTSQEYTPTPYPEAPTVRPKFFYDTAPEDKSHSMGGRYVAYINSDPELFSVEKGGAFDQAGLKPGDAFDMNCAKIGYLSGYISNQKDSMYAIAGVDSFIRNSS